MALNFRHLEFLSRIEVRIGLPKPVSGLRDDPEAAPLGIDRLHGLGDQLSAGGAALVFDDTGIAVAEERLARFASADAEGQCG